MIVTGEQLVSSRSQILFSNVQTNVACPLSIPFGMGMSNRRTHSSSVEFPHCGPLARPLASVSTVGRLPVACAGQPPMMV